jgi:hypothetical protein
MKYATPFMKFNKKNNMIGPFVLILLFILSIGKADLYGKK